MGNTVGNKRHWRKKTRFGRMSLPLSVGKLRKEKRAINATEREESLVVQYLALGGHRWFVTKNKEKIGRPPNRIASCVHAGGGQQTFGWGPRQKSDLMLSFLPLTNDEPARLYYHNHHGEHWHYSGHLKGCPRIGSSALETYKENKQSRALDSFREGLAEALSEVNPSRLLIFYTTTTSCEMIHGMPVSTTVDTDARTNITKTYGSVNECLIAERLTTGDAWLPPVQEYWDPDTLIQFIAQGKATGFVTIKGGRESSKVVSEDPAGHQFGFCVQQHAPTPEQVSKFTKQQIAEWNGWTGSSQEISKLVNNFIARQPPRTLNAGTFFSEETVSTTYLKWLMEARGFENFQITHFLAYEFRNWSADFLEPVLQRRHESKKAGDLVSAECLKLIGNGSYGYNGLESCNYDDLKLMTDKQLASKRNTTLAHLTLKHITLLGVVAVNERIPGERKKKSQRRDQSTFLSNEAVDDGTTSNDSESESVAENLRSQSSAGAFHASFSLEQEMSTAKLSYKNHYREMNKLWKEIIGETNQITRTSEEEDKDEPNADLEEMLVTLREHNYCRSERSDAPTEKKGPHKKKVFRFLYAVSVKGDHKTVLNTLPRAVAVLSNSKRLFLGHLNTMLRCLNPGKAELCYIDTDSCIWSLSEKSLTNCLKEDKINEWYNANILADEQAERSCHGLMKLEGTYPGARFKNLKIYRLYQQLEQFYMDEDAQDKKNLALQNPSASFTRCKGISRKTAEKLPDITFEHKDVQKTIIHRTVLRPTRAGEIWMNHEAKSLAMPFNMKRRVTRNGIHTRPFETNSQIGQKTSSDLSTETE